MKPEAQRIAIFEAVGYSFYEGRAMWIHGRPPTFRSDDADPLNDLNAMHEAENTLSDSQLEVYCNKFCDETAHGGLGLSYCEKQTATAARRAEAFLRTIGKWIDEPTQA